jgi:O-antigen ligase
MQAAAAGARAPLPLSPGLVKVAAVSAAFVIGISLGVRTGAGVGLVAALLYVPLALTNLPLALALWLPIVFVMRIGIVPLAPIVGLLLLALALLGTLRTRDGAERAALRTASPQLGALALLLVWLLLSASQAGDPGRSLDDALQWMLAGLVFVVVVGGAATGRSARWVATAFVLGSVGSVLIGVVAPDVQIASSALETASQADRSRLSGGSGDPNYLAAGIVPALVLLAGLVRRGRSLANLGLLVGAGILTLGLAATESRGGLVAAVVAIVAAFAFFRGRRPQVVILVALLIGLAAGWFSVYPSALERFTTFDEGGTGRTELWGVAWEMARDHPIGGVGLNNFVLESKDYVRRPGGLEFVELIAERPRVAHNVYLQLLAETGVVGLALFLALLFLCVRAAWLAAGTFDARGDPELAALSRSVIVAVAAAATASLFISNGTDWRLWVLIGLGPALLAAARDGETTGRPTIARLR